MQPRARDLALGAAAAGGLVTLLFALIPGLHIAYREPALHAALETATALAALLAAYLAFGRYQARAALDDLLLVCGLALLGLSDLCFAAAPAALGLDEHATFTTWGAIAGRLAGAVVFAAGALVPRRRVRSKTSSVALSLTACAAFVAGLVAAAAVAPALPRGIRPELIGTLDRPRLHALVVVTAVQLASVVIFGLAAAGFVRRAERERDGFMGWLAVAATFAAVSRLNYFLYPSLYSQWVYVGDAFRLLFFVVLLAAVASEIKRYWSRLAEAAVLEERRRLARDLHDGVAQEIAYISRNAALLEGPGADAELPVRIRAAADRAFAEARRAITALAAPADAPVEAVVSEALRDVAARHGATLELDLGVGGRLEPSRLETLVRVACEAVANAARHSGAPSVRVELGAARGRVRLRVLDHGRGFDPEGAVGYGLVSMQERAEAVGGAFRVVSAPGRGTTVEAIL